MGTNLQRPGTRPPPLPPRGPRPDLVILDDGHARYPAPANARRAVIEADPADFLGEPDWEPDTWPEDQPEPWPGPDDYDGPSPPPRDWLGDVLKALDLVSKAISVLVGLLACLVLVLFRAIPVLWTVFLVLLIPTIILGWFAVATFLLLVFPPAGLT